MRRIISPEKLDKLARTIKSELDQIRNIWFLTLAYSNGPPGLKWMVDNLQKQMFNKIRAVQKHGNFRPAIDGLSNRTTPPMSLNNIKREIVLFRSLSTQEMTALARFYSRNFTNLSPGRRSRPSTENRNRYINALARKYQVPRRLLENSNYVADYKKVFNQGDPAVRATRILRRFRAKALENKRLAVATALRNLPRGITEKIINRRALGLPSSPVSVGRLFN